MSKEFTRFKSGIKFAAHAEDIDRENGMLKNVVVINSAQEAKGHGVFIDETAINQFVEQGKAAGDTGLKVRFDHPQMCSRSMGTTIGRLSNFSKGKTGRINSDGISIFEVRADIKMINASEGTEAAANIDHVFDMAEQEPDKLGMSVVFMAGEDYIPAPEDHKKIDPESDFFMPHIRVENFMGADVVDEGAATESLFSKDSVFGPSYLAKQAKFFMEEHKELASTIFAPLVKELVEEQLKSLNVNLKNDNMNKTIKLTASQRIAAIAKGEIELSEEQMSEEVTETTEEVVETPVVEQTTEETTEEVVAEVNTEEVVEELSAEQKEIIALKAEKEILLAKNKAFETGSSISTELESADPYDGEVKMTPNELSAHKNAIALRNRKI